MHKHSCALFLILFFLSFPGFGKQVVLSDARKAAVNFYYERINQYIPTGFSEIIIKETFTKEDAGVPLYYVFNIYPKGYIMVSASDRVVPILAYSFDGKYRPEDQPPQFTSWVLQYEKQIRFAGEKQIVPFPAVASEWKRLLSDNPFSLKKFRDQKNVTPLIFSNWNQDSPYNDMCPADPAGPGGHAYAGCVPVAMAQILYYYRWPDHGTGSYSYNDPPYGTLHANFDSTWYKWDNMVNTIPVSENNPGIAELLYQLGVSCDLVYGAGGSGMYNHKAAYALRTYFKYSPETQYIFRDSTNLAWDSLIMAHLDRKMPLYYAGWSLPNVNGHAFVCDGYQDTAYFHFNFGWDGLYNGYFYLNNLTPGGNNFNLAQELIINCYPDTLHYTYPASCSGATTLHYRSGSLTDGSGPMKNYTSSDCSWLIDPQNEADSIKNISVSFTYFNTNPTDQVTVYDGGTPSDPVLGTFSGNTLPQNLTSTGNKVLITFQAKEGSSAPGWYATYSSESPVWCSGTETIMADTAVITDGSYRFNYHDNSSCRWKLMPENGKPLTVYFRSFDTEQDKDFLKILDLANQQTLAVLSGHYDSTALPSPVTSPSGKMLLLFTSNSSLTGKGWELYYPKSNAGIMPEPSLSTVKIYPNPAHDRIYIDLMSEEKGPAQILLYSVEGNQLKNEFADLYPGMNHFILDITGLPTGLKILRIKSSDQIINQKILITP